MGYPPQSAPDGSMRLIGGVEAVSNELGRSIRRLRKRLGLTLESLSSRAGCTKGYLSSIENGNRVPSLAVVERLESALGISDGSLAGLLAWRTTPEPVRRQLLELRRRTAAAERLTETLRSSSLDELHASGLLRRLVASAEAASEGDDVARGGDSERGTQGEAELSNDDDLRFEGFSGDLGDGGDGGEEGGVGVGDSGVVGLGGAVGLGGLGFVSVPVVNSVQAGYPREFTDLGYPARVADEYVSVPGVTDPDAFAARVCGDSMEPEYREGDIVIFSPMVDAVEGTDCFVRLERDDETTFKRVFFALGGEAGAGGGEGAGGEDGDRRREDGVDDGGGGAGVSIRLQPLNSRYPPRVVAREEVSGMYRAVCVIRRLGVAGGGGSGGSGGGGRGAGGMG